MNMLRAWLPLAFWAPLCFVTYMALTPLTHPAIPRTNDKIMHLLAFGYLTGAFAVAYAHWTTWQRTGGIMLAYGVLIEVVQAFIPNRYCSWLDIVADSTGIALALAGLYMIKGILGWREPVGRTGE